MKEGTFDTVFSLNIFLQVSTETLEPESAIMAEAVILSGNEISKWVKFDKRLDFRILDRSVTVRILQDEHEKVVRSSICHDRHFRSILEVQPQRSSL